MRMSSACIKRVEQEMLCHIRQEQGLGRDRQERQEREPTNAKTLRQHLRHVEREIAQGPPDSLTDERTALWEDRQTWKERQTNNKQVLTEMLLKYHGIAVG
jgi:hypothetical protein